MMDGVLRNTPAQSLIAAAAALGTMSAWWLAPTPLAPLAVVLGVAAVGCALARPFLTCILFLAFTYFRLHEAYPVLNPLRLPLLFSVLALLALAWHMAILRTIKPFYTPELACFFVFFALATASVAFAINRPLAYEAWTSVYWKMGAMTFALAWLVSKPSDLKLASEIFVASGTAIGAVAIYNKWAGIGLVELTRVTIARDLNSVLGDPNDLALVLLFPLSFAIALLIYSPSWWRKMLSAGSIAVILGGIIATQSRGGLIGVLAVATVFGFVTIRSKALVVCCGLAAAMALYGAMNLSSRALGAAHEGGMDIAATERLETWKAAFRMALARPLTGVGLANFAENYFFFTDTFRGRALAAHSTWLSALGETGFPGIAAFVAMIVASFRSVKRSVSKARARAGGQDLHMVAMSLMAALVGFCASGTFLNQAFSWPVYVLVALVAALSRLLDGPGEIASTPERLRARFTARQERSSSDRRPSGWGATC